MSTATNPITADELLRISDGKRYELIEGALRKMTPAGADHGRITNRLAFRLTAHVEANSLGVVYAAETGFILKDDPDTVRAPDVGFLTSRKAPGRHPAYLRGAPDLAVEVVSPGDRVHDIEEKAETWLKAGAGLVWVVWPNTRTLSIHRPGASAQTLREGDTLEGGDVVPGFSCAVTEIFST